MKQIWKKLIETISPGTYDEYLESKEIHKSEIKVYRKNPQFIVDLILYGVPLAYIILKKEWPLLICAFLIVIGEILIRDTISEHYCSLLNKMRKQVEPSAPYLRGTTSVESAEVYVPRK